MTNYYIIQKRCFDIVVAILLLILLLPVNLIIIILLKVIEGGPIFFLQKRIGHNLKTFTIIKYRTMVNNAEQMIDTFDKVTYELFSENFKLKQDPRITKIGFMLRKYGLDELPQLINVIKGDMSIIGPRPITAPELIKYGNKAKYVFGVKPGITGNWQANSKSNTTYKQRIDLDCDYVKTLSLTSDLYIAIKTCLLLIRRLFLKGENHETV